MSVAADGCCQALPLAYMWAMNRTLRYADGPDEVHTVCFLVFAMLSVSSSVQMQLGKGELKRSKAIHENAQRRERQSQEVMKRHNVKAHL